MEELLNKLIEKGWKPFWFKWEETRIEIERDKDLDIQIFKLNWIIIEQHHRISWSLRNLVSKESWLWQFCLENNLVKLIENPNKNKCPRDRMSEEEFRMWEYDVYYSFSNKKDIHKRYEQDSPTYRLIESALCNEKELEKFLLDNIKI